MSIQKKYVLFLLIVGIILLLFTSLFVFTRPAKWVSWDFSNTGQIGDTIGGITAPITGLIGAILVFLSFKAQIKANEIQIKALKEEKKSNNQQKQFDKYASSFDEIRKSLNNIEFIVENKGFSPNSNDYVSPIYVKYSGLNAINEFVLRLENSNNYFHQKYDVFGILISFRFLIESISYLRQQVRNCVEDKQDKQFLLDETMQFYNGFLKEFTNRITQCNTTDLIAEIEKLKIVKEQIDKS